MSENDDEPIHNIYPSLEGDLTKFHMLPTGELLILNVSYFDSQRIFRCRALNLLSQETTTSSSVGSIDTSGIFKFIHMFEIKKNQKLLLFSDMKYFPPITANTVANLTAKVDETIVIPCVVRIYFFMITS